ncbi:hypothetical protein [Abyssalbus ytuae]|uniref:Uncharacterized protein n=1 Tax=Abyssalbus ytuae TaxID=2926907 RepID=A0A9E6ZWS5_9FLAO|nr:hypothetical protein [Abyssalbus ytuae]UOB18241.1 hypothetical protein MQE35_02835 [Abyssalbus ytuae]
MNNSDNLENLFKGLKGQFDVEEPGTGHQDRFLQKLSNHTEIKTLAPPRKSINWWKPLSIAAAIALLFTLGIKLTNNLKQNEIVEVPEEVEKARFYFTSLINSEIEKINAEATTDTKKIIDDAMFQIKKLEDDYKTLENDLIENGNTKQLIHAMITNFQTRVNLLEDVLEQIENVKQLKQTEHENIII